MRRFNPQVRKAGSEQNSLLASSHLHPPCHPGPFTQTQNKGVSLRTSVSQADFSLKSLPSWREKLQANPQPLCFLSVNLIMVTISWFSWQAMVAPCLSCFPHCSDKITPQGKQLSVGAEQKALQLEPSLLFQGICVTAPGTCTTLMPSPSFCGHQVHTWYT